jgi:DNA-nicking Smr family endonuclease
MSEDDDASDDARLFRDAIGHVRLLKPADIAAPSHARPAPEPTQFLLDEAKVRGELLTHVIDPAQIEAGDEITYLKPGQQSRLLTRLRRGQFSVRAEIDLHEMTSAVAREAIREFLDDCRHNDLLCVRIVHGKGLRSAGREPVLKRRIRKLLARRQEVLAFVEPRAVQGGGGAVVVLLEA